MWNMSLVSFTDDSRGALAMPAEGREPNDASRPLARLLARSRRFNMSHMSRDVPTRKPSSALRSFHGIFTSAPEMDGVFRLIERVARTDCTVLVRGESGSGKELAARAIHALSARSRGPFRAVNCATLSPTLLESELFGHVRGAFTGAVANKEGLFKAADGGSLFLDEVAEMPLDIQARLLRVLEERTFLPVGSTRVVSVDVRLISATHRALRREVEEGRFRDDLRYRIRVVPIFLPPLRDRTGDVEALVWHFIDRFNEGTLRRVRSVSREALEALLTYPWPGNVRELRNVIEHAFIVGEGETLGLADLTPELRGEPPPGDDAAALRPVHDGERQRIVAALLRHHGRRADAAQDLGISRSTLWRKLARHNIE
jgi:transcriptional regulator with PAS, ATPase and Fis domain